MGDFGVFPAPGQDNCMKQRHLLWWAENFQKVWYEKEVLKMKSFVTNKGDKLVKTEKFKIKKISEKETERIFEIIL